MSWYGRPFDSYSVEYAKSNRAACKKCKSNIALYAMRVSTNVQGDGDYVMQNWCHFTCMTHMRNVKSASEVKGYDALPPAGKKIIEGLVSGQTYSKLSEPGGKITEAEFKAMKDKKVNAEENEREAARKALEAVAAELENVTGAGGDAEAPKAAVAEVAEDSGKATATVAAAEDYNSMSVKDLKALCAEKGLPAKGKKADLVAALEGAARSGAVTVTTTTTTTKTTVTTEVAPAPMAVDYSRMTVKQLREECSSKGLDDSGKKAELLARLEGAAPAAAAPAEAEATAEPEGEAVDYSSWTIAALKAELKSRGVTPAGKKAELVAQLQKAGAAPAAAASKGTKRKRDDEDDAAGPASKKAKRPVPKRDKFFHGTGAVLEDYDALLNMSDVKRNSNGFYILQIIHTGGSKYVLWTRWGRVGESGENQRKDFTNKDNAIKAFTDKFWDKTKNKWAERDNFIPVPGRFTLMEMADDDEANEIEAALQSLAPSGPRPTKVRPSKLDGETQNLIKLLFDPEMFTSAMKKMDIDVKKMPLGKISKSQIEEGFKTLLALKHQLDAGKADGVTALTSRFYTLIPHDFGRDSHPTIDNAEAVQQKMDMLAVLGDIVYAQALLGKKKEGDSDIEYLPNPIDTNYDTLHTKLEYVAPDSDEFKWIETYTYNTASTHRRPTILAVWKVARDSEPARFAQHSDMGNRKLLWHGTNVAVVAAILGGGMRIMPHAGGRVGRGLYFASENGKSAGYVQCTGDRTGIMFLNEVVLGRESHITRDDPSLRKAPDGTDCVIAKGHTEPDPSKEITVQFDGHDVVVPQGKPIRMPKYSHSTFTQTEYLVYKESQVSIRYLLKCRF